MDFEKAHTLAELARVAGELDKLRNTPGWLHLVKHYDNQKAQYEASMMAKLTSGGPTAPELNQRVLDYQRGFWAGVQSVLSSPSNAQAELVAERKKI